VAFSPDGRYAAAGGGQTQPHEGVARVWDLQTGAVQTLDPGDGQWITELHFTSAGELVMGSGSGVRLWNLDDGTARVLQAHDSRAFCAALAHGGDWVVSVGLDLATFNNTDLVMQDLTSGATTIVRNHGTTIHQLAFGPRDEVLVSGDFEGMVRAGPVAGGEPHLLFGHEGMVWDVEVTPDGRHIASVGDDGTLRLWPMPDMSKPPLHTLPYDELLNRLRSLTNFRVVEDEQSPTGYSIEAGPFPGWEELPKW
jgi:WD40 repeat protein